jgi:putative membrane protein
MYHAHYLEPHGHLFWIIPALFMVLMMVCIVRRIRSARRWRAETGGRTGWRSFGCCGPRRERTSQILDRRYAGGEITKEQYEQFKRDLEANRWRPQPEGE